MKKKYTKIVSLAALFALSTGVAGCTDYLDKEADSIVSQEDAFKNFTNFQGFLEEIYNCVPDKQKCDWRTTYNWGEDEILNAGIPDAQMINQMDLGNFRAWDSSKNCWLYRSDSDPTETTGHYEFKHTLWPHAWYCIRKANLGLENLDKLTVATQEERDMIAGQLYFFRAWWHEELIQFFGGLPYIDKAFDASEKLDWPRLSYQDCAKRCAEDFRKAADLLPINWDNTATGRRTLGKNDLRINKITALGYLGRVNLWAASPLMEHGAQLGAISSGKTYEYNKEFAAEAAKAFGELLTLVENGETQYALAGFDYEDIYNHKKKSTAENCYSDIFYTVKQGWKLPGTTESIFRVGSVTSNTSLWYVAKSYAPMLSNLSDGGSQVHHPTANYVNYYGMANGLPINDPQSGFDKEHPFKDRDPRFYHDIVFDGLRYVNTVIPADKEPAAVKLQYAGLFTGGVMRDASKASRTGYLCQKLIPHTANKFDGDTQQGNSLQCNLPYMRLADIYLMYAEAGAAIGGAAYKADNYSKTTEEAVNVIRERCGAGKVHAKYTTDPHLFMDEVRRERAVELSFEGHRFNDLQRWLLLTEYPYTVKTSQEFNRVEPDSYYESNNFENAMNAKVAKWEEKVILKRVYGTKHYWLPLPNNDVYLYEGFPQNPGW